MRKRAGALLAGLACLLVPACERQTVLHPASLLRPTVCALSSFFPFFVLPSSSREGRYQRDICVRSRLSLLKLRVAPTYHGGVLCSVSLPNSFFFFVNMYQKPSHCVKHRAQGMAERKAPYCNFFFLGTVATIKHLYSPMFPADKKPQGKMLTAQERKSPLSTHSSPPNTGKYLS